MAKKSTPPLRPFAKTHGGLQSKVARIKRAVGSHDRPNVFRLTHLAIREILGDANPDPEEVAHREWLRRRLSEETQQISAITQRIFE
jgi:hypothetical protein